MCSLAIPSDEWYLQRCIHLASLGEGYAAPNPMVGAILVYERRILSEGWHEYAGGPHAEVNCINRVQPSDRHLLAKSILYVSLEPCSHYGKTPPCVDLILASKIPKVVIASQDTFSKVNGQGIAKLIAAGVEVVVAKDQKAARRLNKHFFTYHESKRPYIALKWAQTDNHIIGTGSSERLMISNAITQRWVHQLRTKYNAILVGANTVINDNPLLDARYYMGKAPIKIVIDTLGELHPNYRLFHEGAETWLFTTDPQSAEVFKELPTVNVVKLAEEHFLQNCIQYIYNQQLTSILIEGGASILQGFIDAGLWDEAFVIQSAHSYIGEGVSAPKLFDEQLIGINTNTGDTINHYTNVSNRFYL